MAGVKLTTTSFIVLGLLERAGEATPYELKQLVAGSVGNFWSVPHSQLYAEPTRLVALGLVAEEHEDGGRRRRTYSLTEPGRRALDGWLGEPADAGTELRDLALLKLYFGGQAGPGAVQRVAGEAAALHRHRLAGYEAIVGDPPGYVDLHQLSILALAARYESEAVAFWTAVATDPDLTE